MKAPIHSQDKQTVDYDLLGVVGIRLENATPVQIAAIGRQIGSPAGTLKREPDITIRLENNLPALDKGALLGLNDTLFTEDRFYIIRGDHINRQMVQVDFRQIGGPVALTCHNGLSAVPSLINPVINFMMLKKGYIPLHATAFALHGTGVLLTGWSKSGKTEILLAFMEHGAEFIGDEYIYIDAEGKSIRGIRKPITLWEWHLPELDRYWHLIGRSERARLRTLRTSLNILQIASRKNVIPGRFLNNIADRVIGEIQIRMATKISPRKIFGQQVKGQVVQLDKVVFTATHLSREVRVRPMDTAEIAARMAHSNSHQRKFFMDYYRKYLFAFPENTNDLIDGIDRLELDALVQALAQKDGHRIDHPYPVPFEDLFAALHPAIRASS